MGFLSLFKRGDARAAKPKTYTPKFKAGLSLSGGGARGFAHIGAIRAFEENDIDFSIVTGTSVGSLVGSLYAYGLNSQEMIELAKSIDAREIRTSKLFFRPSPSKNIENLMYKIYENIKFSDLPKRFALSTVDLKTGDEVVISEGNLAKAVSASCAVPLVFTPVEWGNYRLVDGGLVNVIPSDVARQLGAEVVVSVDINSTRGSGTDSIKIFDMFFTVFKIAMKSAAVKGIMNSDIIIKPDLKTYKATKFEGWTEMIEEGYRAALEAVPKIKELIGYKR
ncbi:MAG: patatin-like phospholipase family protein [Clostridia bacterium]|nr:patatin-like phospholipase family protein [Clostridia bacterium]